MGRGDQERSYPGGVIQYQRQHLLACRFREVERATSDKQTHGDFFWGIKFRSKKQPDVGFKTLPHFGQTVLKQPWSGHIYMLFLFDN
jgi:hypothetical protein